MQQPNCSRIIIHPYEVSMLIYDKTDQRCQDVDILARECYGKHLNKMTRREANLLIRNLIGGNCAVL